VATTSTIASICSGGTSGVGLAIANTIARAAIRATPSTEIAPG
jgi:hypothetical protein